MLQMTYRTKSPRLVYDQSVLVENKKQGERLVKNWNRVNKTQSSDYTYYVIKFQQIFLNELDQEKYIPLKESDSMGYIEYLSHVNRDFKIVEDRR